MITLRVHKSEDRPRDDDPQDLEPIDPVIIEVITPLPLPASVEEVMRWFDLDAQIIFNGLRDSLPDGTFERLVYLMTEFGMENFNPNERPPF